MMNLKESLINVFKEQLENGIIEEVADTGDVANVTYLPHREVIREDKSSTKLRVVFDASAKSNGNVSLNEALYKGPSLNPELFDLLLKFRINLIAITADIEKAYLQINVDEEHRDFLRFLWYKDVFADVPEIVKYRFCRVIFGATCSQFLLNGTNRTHAKKYEKIDPEFARRVLKHFYVDDLTTVVSNVEEGVDLYNNIKSRFNEAQFNVRKWRTNNEELRAIINKKEKINNDINNNNTSRKNEKVLGIAWNEDNDNLILGVNELFESVINIEPTQRETFLE